MRPRIYVPLSPADRAAVVLWSRRMLVACGCVIMLFVAYVLVAQRTELIAHDGKTQQQTQSASHVRWRE